MKHNSLPVTCRYLFPKFFLLMLRKRFAHRIRIHAILKIKNNNVVLYRGFQMKIRLYAALMLLGFLLLTACGGGGSPPASESNNWDGLVWDQNNWS